MIRLESSFLCSVKADNGIDFRKKFERAGPQLTGGHGLNQVPSFISESQKYSSRSACHGYNFGKPEIQLFNVFCDYLFLIFRNGFRFECHLFQKPCLCA